MALVLIYGFGWGVHTGVTHTLTMSALIFATLFYLVISFTGGGVSPAVKLANTAVMFVLFWSMGWMVENFVWRRYQKKQGGPAA